MNRTFSPLRRYFLLLLGVLALTAPAQARVFVGIGVPLPFYAPPMYYPPPPVYYPPPQYYAPPPPVMYTPPQAAPSYRQSCDAGDYICPLDRPLSVGAPCYCVGNNGQRVHGNAH
ncbi:MAG: hypothetical protein WCI94_09510 [Rhodospirillales bacterium]